MYWKSEKSMMLYPTVNELNTDFSEFHKGCDNDNLYKLGFIKVMKGNELNTNVGNEILDLLNINEFQ